MVFLNICDRFVKEGGDRLDYKTALFRDTFYFD